MKKLIALLSLGFVACGKYYDFKDYQPDHLSEIQTMVEKTVGVPAHSLDDLHFFYGENKDVIDDCVGQNIKQINQIAPACVNENVVVIDQKFKDQCWIIAHEMVHRALFIKTRDPDHDHKTNYFAETYNNCWEIHLPPTVKYY